MSSRLFLGIDGGGSKTTAVVFDANGIFVNGAIGESINYYTLGLEAARENMRAIISALGCEGTFEGAVIGMSALSCRATAQECRAFAREIIDADRIIMDSDLFAALKALGEKGECAVVVAGTGSMVLVQYADGTTATAGGWGHILGDEGSGYAIGLDGIKAAIRGYEGSECKTALTDEVIRFFGIDAVADLIDLFYSKGVSRKQTAAFAVSVRTLAEDGDSAAQHIILNHARELFKTAICRISSLDRSAPIGLWGGIFQNCTMLRDEFSSLLRGAGYSNVKLLDFTPEVGAILACFDEFGIKTDNNMLNNIKTTYNTDMCKAI